MTVWDVCDAVIRVSFLHGLLLSSQEALCLPPPGEGFSGGEGPQSLRITYSHLGGIITAHDGFMLAATKSSVESLASAMGI